MRQLLGLRDQIVRNIEKAELARPGLELDFLGLGELETEGTEKEGAVMLIDNGHQISNADNAASAE